MKQKILEIIGWVFLVMFVSLFVFAIKVKNNNYKDYLVEYENAQDEIIYEVFEYEQLTNHKGFTIYKVVIDGETYYTTNVKYEIGSGDGFYFVMTKKQKQTYEQYLFYGLQESRDVYNYKLLVVY